MTRHQFEELLKRYTLGDCTREERIRICYWFQKIEFEHEIILSKEEQAVVEQEILKTIEDKINKTESKSKTSVGGFINTCLIYAGTFESLILIEILNSDLLFT